MGDQKRRRIEMNRAATAGVIVMVALGVLMAGVNIGTVVPLIWGLFFMSFALLFVVRIPVNPPADTGKY